MATLEKRVSSYLEAAISFSCSSRINLGNENSLVVPVKRVAAMAPQASLDVHS